VQETADVRDTWALDLAHITRTDVYAVAQAARFARCTLVMSPATLDAFAGILHVQPRNVGATLAVAIDPARGRSWPDGIVTTVPR
jgi:hypothetical protein